MFNVYATGQLNSGHNSGFSDCYSKLATFLGKVNGSANANSCQEGNARTDVIERHC